VTEPRLQESDLNRHERMFQRWIGGFGGLNLGIGLTLGLESDLWGASCFFAIVGLCFLLQHLGGGR
jgi:hypothetical protein